MSYLRDLDDLIAKAIKAGVRKITPFSIGLIITFAVLSIALMMNFGDTPDITNTGVIVIMAATELLCFLAIWIYIKKLPSRRL